MQTQALPQRIQRRGHAPLRHPGHVVAIVHDARFGVFIGLPFVDLANGQPHLSSDVVFSTYDNDDDDNNNKIMMMIMMMMTIIIMIIVLIIMIIIMIIMIIIIITIMMMIMMIIIIKMIP